MTAANVSHREWKSIISSDLGAVAYSKKGLHSAKKPLYKSQKDPLSGERTHLLEKPAGDYIQMRPGLRYLPPSIKWILYSFS